MVLLITAAVGVTRGLAGVGAGEDAGPAFVSCAPTPDLDDGCSTRDGVGHLAARPVP